MIPGLLTGDPPLISRLRPLISRLRPLISRLRPFISRLRPFISRLRPLISSIRPLRAALLALFALALTGGETREAVTAPDPYSATVVVTSADLSQRLTPLGAIEFGRARVKDEPVINIDAQKRYQAVGGFGAAMTDTSAWLIERHTSAATRQALMSQLFGAGGIHLSFVRIPMGASDFTHDGRPYTYDDMPAGRSDPGLSQFSVAHDEAYVLPALRQALAHNPQAHFLASPWTPPAWMKSNHALGNAGDRGTLLPEAYRAWGRYFARFLTAYARAGVPVDSVTAQNEPGTPTLYPGLNLPAATEARWIVQDLEPALKAAGLHTKIYGGDLGWGPHSKGYMTTDISGASRTALSGISWHCYFGEPSVMARFQQADPRLDEILDECSPGLITPTPTPEIVIGSLRESASTVALWNLALDPAGGPVQPPNHGCPGCLGLAKIDERTGSVSYTQAYYQLGQASAFVAPGAQRIASNHFVSYVYPRPGVSVVTSGLDDVAFRNPDGSLVLVAYDNARAPVHFAVRWRGRALSYSLAPGEMATLVWNQT